jgi:DNA-binding beta-propeller fold protein YncE
MSGRARWIQVCVFSSLFLFLCQAAHAVVPTVVVAGQIPYASGLNQPQSVFVSGNGTVYVADSGNNRVVTVTNGTVTPIATSGYTLSFPGAVIADPAGDVYIADTYNARVRFPAAIVVASV